MATIRKGILGAVNGLVGTVVGSKWRKLAILRSRPRRRSKSLRNQKKDQHFKLGGMSAFLSRFKDDINVGLYKKSGKVSPISLAMKYNLANASISTGANFEIDYPKIVFSQGNGERAWSEQIFFEPDRKIRITWDIPETANLKAIGKDNIRLMVYNVTKDLHIQPPTVAVRNTQTLTIDIGERSLDCLLHVWMFFVSPDGKTISNSDYIGSGIIIA